MPDNKNRRETGATKYPARNGPDPSDAFSQSAAGNRKPKGGVGLTRPVNEVDDKTHQSDGQNPAEATPGRAKGDRP
jgi:hypothetical protein